MQDTKEKEEMLETVAMTGSWFELKALEGMLAPKVLQALKREIDSIVRREYPKRIYDKQLQEEIQERINGNVFVVDKDENGQYMFRTYWPKEFKGKEYISAIIDVEKIDREVLRKKTIAAMKKHLDFDKFYDEKGYTGEEIREALVSGIQKYSKIEIDEKESKSHLAKDNNLLASAVEATKKRVRMSGIRNAVNRVKEYKNNILKKSTKNIARRDD